MANKIILVVSVLYVIVFLAGYISGRSLNLNDWLSGVAFGVALVNIFNHFIN